MNRYISLIALTIFLATPAVAADIAAPNPATPVTPPAAPPSITPPTISSPVPPGTSEAAHGPSDYTTMSVEELQAEADKGDAKAQYYLGEHFGQRNSLNSDFGVAAKWYEKSANQGNADAQFKLGLLYQDALGETQNPATAYFWVALAAKSGNKQYVTKRDEMEKALKPPLVAAIKQKVDAWKPLTPNATATDASDAKQAPADAPAQEPAGIPGVTPPEQ